MHAGTIVRRVLFAIVVLAPGLARAQATAPPQPPCLEDARRLCGQVPQDGDWVAACLEGHQNAVSANCRKHLDTLARDISTMHDVCAGDLDRLCSDVVSTAGARMSCLLDHRRALSRKCRERLDAESAK